MIKKMFKWWWGWEPEVVEEWLEIQENAGWNLFHVDTAAIRFHFSKGVPRKIRYCADYQNTIKPEYKKLFEDDGWSLVYSDSTGWYIWAKPYEGQRPAIYTDVDSLLGRNNRLMRVLSMGSVALIASQLPLLHLSLRNGSFSAMFSFLPLYGFAFAFFGFCFIELRRANKNLKDKCVR